MKKRYLLLIGILMFSGCTNKGDNKKPSTTSTRPIDTSSESLESSVISNLSNASNILEFDTASGNTTDSVVSETIGDNPSVMISGTTSSEVSNGSSDTAISEDSSNASTSGEVIESNVFEYTLSESKDSYILTGLEICTDTNIVIPSTFEGLPVTGIGENAFSGCSSLTSIKIPTSVTNIGKSAFSGCSSLTIYCEASSQPSEWDSDWNHSDSPVYWGINENNHLEQDGLIYVVIDGNAVVTGHKANITNVVIPSTITINETEYSVIGIGNSAFSWCSSLTSIEIPTSVTSIGESALGYCSSLIIYCEVSAKPSGWNSKWNISDSPVYWGINENNHLEQDGLIYVVVDGNAIVTGHKANITNVIVPSTITINRTQYNVTSIGSWTFSNCDSLTSIEIPNSVTSIGEYVFYGCDFLTSIAIPNGVTSIGSSVFSWCSSLTSIVIPNSVTSIEWFAFSRCSSLTSIEIPNSVTSIGDYAFYDCDSLTSMVIPNSVTSIGYVAFSNCNSLTIYCDTSSQPSGWNSDWNYSNRPVYWAGQWSYVDDVPTPNK